MPTNGKRGNAKLLQSPASINLLRTSLGEGVKAVAAAAVRNTRPPSREAASECAAFLTHVIHIACGRHRYQNF